MLRIVLPAGISPSSAPSPRLLRWAVSAANIVAVAPTNIRVAVKIVVVVYVDVVVAAPAAAPAPATAPERPHHHANAERNRYSRGIVSRWGIVDGWVGINWRTVDHDRIIRRDIHDLRIRLFHDDYAFVLDNPGFDLLLLGGFQIAGVLCLLAHTLDGIHHIGLLRQECIAQIRRPLNIVCEALYHFGQTGQGLNAGIPRLL